MDSNFRFRVRCKRGLGEVAPAPAAARSVPTRGGRPAGQLSYLTPHLRHPSIAGGSAAAGDRGQPWPLRHAHDRATLCPSCPVTCRPGHPRDDAETRARRAEPGRATSSSPGEGASAAKEPVGAECRSAAFKRHQGRLLRLLIMTMYHGTTIMRNML
jgi:hypothetical protein